MRAVAHCRLGWLLVLALLAAAACSGPQAGLFRDRQRGPLLLWPRLPAEPRVEWLGVLPRERSAEDRGFWASLWYHLTGEELTPILRPHGVYAWGDRVAVTSPVAGELHLLDLRARKRTTLRGPDEQPFESPLGVTGNGEDVLFLSDSKSTLLYRIVPAEERVEPWGHASFRRPTGLVYNPRNGFLYVADTLGHAVVVLGPEGYERLRFGGRGDRPGQLYFPTHLSVDRWGRIWVTDTLNFRIQCFTAEGEFVRAFGEAGDTSGRFSSPKGVGVDGDGNVYVADALFDSVQVFDEWGRLLLTFGAKGDEAGEFWMPAGLYVDAENRIFVADSYNQRIQVFRYLEASADAFIK